MKFPSVEAIAMKVAALSLRERIRLTPPEPAGAFPGERFLRWRRTFLGSTPDNGLIASRLRNEGASPDQFMAALNGNHGDPDPNEDWTRRLSGILDQATAASLPARDGDFHQAIPFAELMDPFRRQARQETVDRLKPRLSSAALRGLDDLLTANLSRLMSRCLLATFLQRPGRRNYRSFAEDMLEGGYDDFFPGYPVLGRLAAEAITEWVAAVGRFAARLDQDATRLHPDGSVVVRRITGNWSDSHPLGLGVLRVEFEGGGPAWFYKPRDGSCDAALYHCISALNRRGLDPSLLAPQILPREGYCWVESIEHLPCSNRSEMERFYQRAGGLLAILHAFRATDCHYENLIAHRDHPVLVDAEMLMQSDYDSVATTGLLPSRVAATDGPRVDVSGLGAEDDEDTGFESLEWTGIGSDSIQRQPKPRRTRPRSNRPGATVSCRDHLDAVIHGFRATHQFIETHREAMLESIDPGRLRPRLVVRPSHVYDCLQTRILEPRFLRDGRDRSIELEWLARAYLPIGTAGAWNLLREEQTALEGCRIPRFNALPRERYLYHGEAPIVTGYLPQEPLESLSAQLEQLDAADREKQIAAIDSAFRQRYDDPG